MGKITERVRRCGVLSVGLRKPDSRITACEGAADGTGTRAALVAEGVAVWVCCVSSCCAGVFLDAAQRSSYLAPDHLEPESEDGGQIPAQVGALAVRAPDILALQEITQGTHAYDERPKTHGLAMALQYGSTFSVTQRVLSAAGQPFLRLQIQQVPHTPVRFRLPAVCDFCQAKGTIVPGTTVQGNTVLMVWVCRECGGDRPITRREQKPERRSGQADRRRTTRKERRRSN